MGKRPLKIIKFENSHKMSNILKILKADCDSVYKIKFIL